MFYTLKYSFFFLIIVIFWCIFYSTKNIFQVQFLLTSQTTLNGVFVVWYIQLLIYSLEDDALARSIVPQNLKLAYYGHGVITRTTIVTIVESRVLDRCSRRLWNTSNSSNKILFSVKLLDNNDNDNRQISDEKSSDPNPLNVNYSTIFDIL